MDDQSHLMVFAPISMDGVEAEIATTLQPLIVACIHQDYNYDEQLASLAKFAEQMGHRVQVRLLDMRAFDRFGDKFNVHGTPVFLIFMNGTESQRLLGYTDLPGLIEWVLEVISPPDHMN